MSFFLIKLTKLHKSLYFAFLSCAVDMLSFVILKIADFLFRIFLVLEGKHEDTCGFNFVEVPQGLNVKLSAPKQYHISLSA